MIHLNSRIDKEYIIVEEVKKGFKVQFGLDVSSEFAPTDKTHHVVSESLGISAYADSKKEALEAFTEVVQTFIEYAVESDQVDSILKECGFKKIGQATPYHNIYIRKINQATFYLRGDFEIKTKGRTRKTTGRKIKKRVAT